MGTRRQPADDKKGSARSAFLFCYPALKIFTFCLPSIPVRHHGEEFSAEVPQVRCETASKTCMERQHVTASKPRKQQYFHIDSHDKLSPGLGNCIYHASPKQLLYADNKDNISIAGLPK